MWKFKKEYSEYDLDVDEVLKHFQYKKEYLDTTFNFKIQWGGNLAFHSILKIVLDYYTYEGYDIEYLIDCLVGEEKKDIVKMYFPINCLLNMLKERYLI